MTIRLLALTAGLALALAASADAQTFTSSNLPIVLIDTGGADIPDEPKIPALMAIVDNGPGVRNAVTDPPTGYDGHIGIEVRGSSSQFFFPKKQYGFETRDASGEDDAAVLLGLPEESDWILYAPYTDKSLMRDVLAYRLGRATGHYAPRTRYCEVVLNGEYQGIYVLVEKIKRDSERVAVDRLRATDVAGDELTGGYILQIDRGNEGEGGHWTSPFPPAYPTSAVVRYEFDDPNADDLLPVQEAYIEQFVTGFEALMASPDFADPAAGYAATIDIGSFVDFVLVNELARNVDGYRLSTYLHKDKDSVDPRLRAGPLWDFNLGFGNADYYGGANRTGFQVDFAEAGDGSPVPFFWPRLFHEAAFQDSLGARWAGLRQGVLHPDSLAAFIATTAAGLDEAQQRNFVRWPILGEYVWPNAYVGETYADEVAYLGTWIAARAAWMDGQFPVPVASESGSGGAGHLSAPSPNPARGASRVSLSVGREQHVVVAVYDVLGRRVARLHDGPVAPGRPLRLDVAAQALPAGVYVVRADGETFAAAQRLTVAR